MIHIINDLQFTHQIVNSVILNCFNFVKKEENLPLLNSLLLITPK